MMEEIDRIAEDKTFVVMYMCVTYKYITMKHRSE